LTPSALLSASVGVGNGQVPQKRFSRFWGILVADSLVLTRDQIGEPEAKEVGAEIIPILLSFA
jgi:hypothetical protein